MFESLDKTQNNAKRKSGIVCAPMRDIVTFLRKFLQKEVKQDEGWCWLMFIGVCVNMFLVFGVHYTYGVIFPSMLEEFKKSQGSTAWLGSLASGLLFVSSLVSVKVSEITNVTITCFIGAVFSGVGIILTSVITKFEWLYLFYGVFFGVGSSFLYTPGLILLAQWFKRHRSITTGVATASASFGAVVLSPLIQYAIKTIGLRATIKSGGLIYLFLSITCVLTYHPLVLQNQREKKSAKVTRPTTLPASMDFLKNKGYCVFLVCAMVTNFSYYIPLFFLVKYAEGKGSSPMQSGLLITLWSLSNIVGRLMFGKFIAHQRRHLLRTYQVAMFWSACVSLSAAYATAHWQLVCYVISYGFLDGSFIGLLSLVTLELVGNDKMARGYGLLLTSIGGPIALGPVITGYINDKQLLPANAMFLIPAVSFFVGSMLMIIVIRQNVKNWPGRRQIIVKIGSEDSEINGTDKLKLLENGSNKNTDGSFLEDQQILSNKSNEVLLLEDSPNENTENFLLADEHILCKETDKYLLTEIRPNEHTEISVLEGEQELSSESDEALIAPSKGLTDDDSVLKDSDTILRENEIQQNSESVSLLKNTLAS